MDASQATVEELAELSAMVRAIQELDVVVQAMLMGLAGAKPWQRQLRAHLLEADRHLQILRMTIALVHDAGEILEAADAVLRAMRSAHAYVTTGRADIGTKTTVHIAFQLGKKVPSEIRRYLARAPANSVALPRA